MTKRLDATGDKVPGDYSQGLSSLDLRWTAVGGQRWRARLRDRVADVYRREGGAWRHVATVPNLPGELRTYGISLLQQRAEDQEAEG